MLLLVAVAIPLQADQLLALDMKQEEEFLK